MRSTQSCLTTNLTYNRTVEDIDNGYGKTEIRVNPINDKMNISGVRSQESRLVVAARLEQRALRMNSSSHPDDESVV